MIFSQRLLKFGASTLRALSTSSSMSNSKFEYVRNFESDDKLLPNCWIVVRVDGKAFHKFSERHAFEKPNDKRALDLMNACARKVMLDYADLVLAYGQSDEFSFVFRKDTQLYSRRSSKLMTNIASLFASNYVFQWAEYFPDKKLEYPPTFDARTVLYPSNKTLRDYLSWRQVDCHINNLYNTTFWTLIQKGGLSNSQAQERLRGSYSADKNEILFSEFGLNYNNEPDMFKKGTTIFREDVALPISEDCQVKQGGKNSSKVSGDLGTKIRKQIKAEYCDVIGDEFWIKNDHILEKFKDS